MKPSRYVFDVDLRHAADVQYRKLLGQDLTGRERRVLLLHERRHRLCFDGAPMSSRACRGTATNRTSDWWPPLDKLGVTRGRARANGGRVTIPFPKRKVTHAVAVAELRDPRGDLSRMPETELEYGNPFELLIAVILSAQCTDKRVNLTTPFLFARYPDAAALAAAQQERR